MRDLHRNKPQLRLPACSGKRDFPVAPARPLPWAGFFPALFYCFRVNPQPGIKAPGHRLPVPAGWRFGEAGPTFVEAATRLHHKVARIALTIATPRSGAGPPHPIDAGGIA